MLKVLIGCECSGTVRDAFLRRGFDAWSCDLKPDEHGSNRHIRGDVRDVLKYERWDLLTVLHPPCTRLTNSGVRWLSQPPGAIYTDNHTQEEVDAFALMTEPERLAFMWRKLDEGASLFSDCLNADVPCVAVENPVMHRYAKERIRGFFPHTQSVQPWQFGTDPDGPDNEKKRTCLWLRNLPKLVPTGTLDGSDARSSVHLASAKNRGVERSRFFPGIADAMAEQWGNAALQLAQAA
jgi:hypothetical protein